MALLSMDQSASHQPGSRGFPVNSSRSQDELTSRRLLVARLAQQLAEDSAPRIHLCIIMMASGGAAFLSSVLMLWSGSEAFQSMTLRYPAAALCGYLAFIALIRLWISVHRPSEGFDIDPTSDIADAVVRASVPRSTDVPDVPQSLELESTRPRAEASVGRAVRDSVLDAGSAGWDLDVGDFIWLVVAAACAIGGLLAIGYVIYIAPVLLAEVALDAAIISALYRRLRADEAGYWLTSVVTRTWVPALVLVVFAIGVGFALEMIAPDARSIGGVIRTISN
jgi:hypothetical protein